MWDWAKRLFGGVPQPAERKLGSGAAHSVGSAFGYWIATRGRELAQGDWIPGCRVPVYPAGVPANLDTEVVVDLAQLDLIIVTQSCDLENRKARFVALCPIFRLEEFSHINPKFGKKAERDEIRKGRHEGLHMLASPTEPGNNLDALIVDFRQIYSLPFDYLAEHADQCRDRWRLQPPYLEHFSQAFARFFMRVGLPSSIPPFK